MHLSLDYVQEHELEAFVEVEFQAFHTTLLHKLEYPDGYTSEVAARMLQSRSEIFRDPKYTFMKVTDSNTGTLVSVAYWFTNTEDSPESVWKQPILAIDATKSLNDAYGFGLRRLRQTYIRGRKRVHFGIVATIPEYRGHGAARLLLEACNKHADEVALPITIIASTEAAPLYHRYGYRDIDGAVDNLDLKQWGSGENWTSILMLRGSWYAELKQA